MSAHSTAPAPSGTTTGAPPPIPPKTKGMENIPLWVYIIPILFVVIFTLWYFNTESESENTTVSDGTSELSVPPFSHKYFTLTKGDTIPLKNYDEWVLYCSSAGTPKKPNLFMHKDEGANWEICGDWQGNELVDHGIGETGFDAYLTAYNKDVQVICWYEKMKNNVKK